MICGALATEFGDVLQEHLVAGEHGVRVAATGTRRVDLDGERVDPGGAGDRLARARRKLLDPPGRNFFREPADDGDIALLGGCRLRSRRRETSGR
eukprot:15466815-Alexandrium_andersonii.AAC.1